MKEDISNAINISILLLLLFIAFVSIVYFSGGLNTPKGEDVYCELGQVCEKTHYDTPHCPEGSTVIHLNNRVDKQQFLCEVYE